MYILGGKQGCRNNFIFSFQVQMNMRIRKTEFVNKVYHLWKIDSKMIKKNEAV